MASRTTIHIPRFLLPQYGPLWRTTAVAARNPVLARSLRPDVGQVLVRYVSSTAATKAAAARAATSPSATGGAAAADKATPAKIKSYTPIAVYAATTPRVAASKAPAVSSTRASSSSSAPKSSAASKAAKASAPTKPPPKTAAAKTTTTKPAAVPKAAAASASTTAAAVAKASAPKASATTKTAASATKTAASATKPAASSPAPPAAAAKSTPVSKPAAPAAPADPSKPIVLEKPERFNPPSHGKRLPRAGGPKHYGGAPSAAETAARRSTSYPGLPPPDDSWSHWFINSRAIHLTITLGTLSALAIWTFTVNFRAKSPYADLLPPLSDLAAHPFNFFSACFEVLRLTEEHESAITAEKRRQKVEDVAKREEFRRAHGLEPARGLFGLGTVDRKAEEEKRQQQQQDDDASPVAAVVDAQQHPDPSTPADGKRQKFLGIF